MEQCSRIYAEIDTNALLHNLYALHEKTAPGTRIIAVVKTDAYGHGALPIAKCLEKEGCVWGFAVATAHEGLLLRVNGIIKPVLVLGYVFEEDYDILAEWRIRPVVFTRTMAVELSEAAQRAGKTLPIHIGLDTGMSRIGFADTDENVGLVRRISRYSRLEIEGIFTHFAKADETDKSSTEAQFRRYMDFVGKLQATGVYIPLRHVSNSAALMELPHMSLDLVRAGIALYGIYPSEQVSKEAAALLPVMSLHSHIAHIKTVEAGTQISYGGTFTADRTMRIATIPVGYGDGYPRSLSNKGYVLIHGKRARIVGRICMDQFMVDVTDIPEAGKLSEVVLVGTQGRQTILVETLAELSGRFPYEFVCDINRRVPRVYMKDGKDYLIKRNFF